MKRKNAMLYSNLLRDIRRKTPCSEQKWAFSTFWMYAILVDDDGTGSNRLKLLDKLNKNGVQARPFFRPLHTLPPYLRYDSSDITVANGIYERGINLPCSVTLKKREIERVVEIISDTKVH